MTSGPISTRAAEVPRRSASLLPRHEAVTRFCLVLAALVLLQALPSHIWSGGWLLVVLVGGLGWLNARSFSVGALCWPNIFLGILALFHLGYYLLVVHDAVKPLAVMPSVAATPSIDLALQVFATACVAFEVGLLGVLSLTPRRNKPPSPQRSREEQAFFRLGLAVTLGSVVLFAVYVVQIGGLAGLTQLDYSRYVTFIQAQDPRFAALSTIYLPSGLLLLYTFLDRRGLHHQRSAVWILVPFFIFTLWLLWVGNRGIALLSWVALAYIHHATVRRIPFRHAVIVILAIFAVIGPIRQIRNVPTDARLQAFHHVSYNPLGGVSEMGRTFKPYLVFVQTREEGRSLGFDPYPAAVGHIVPRARLSWAQGADSPIYVRSVAWVSYVSDPIAWRYGFGSGGSAVGEPYAVFGLTGVVLIFVLLGVLIAFLETRAVVERSAAALALIPLVFYAINWHVRDDAYGLLRPVFWGVLAVVGVKCVLALNLLRQRNQPP
jgi:O-antigen polysaccharide polymerase Wzy